MSSKPEETAVRQADLWQAEAEARRAERSPRLKQPKHHRIVRPSARFRRRAIRLAGMMLLAAAVLGVYTAAGILAQAGTVRPPVLPENPVEVQGRVTQPDGTELVNATVRVVNGTNSSATNSDGWYYLGELRPGTYTLEASKPGFTTVRKTVEVSPGIPRLVDFSLAPGNATIDVPAERIPTFVDPTVGAFSLGFAVLLCSIMTFVGALSALTQRHYLVAVAGAAAGVLTIGFFVGTVLSIAALAVLASLKTGFLEEESHRIPWEGKPLRRGRGRAR